VDSVPVEVDASAVVVLGSARVGVAGQDLSVSQRYACVEGIGDRGVAQGVGLIRRGMPATFAILVTIR
jgi:hypothetical protein